MTTYGYATLDEFKAWTQLDGLTKTAMATNAILATSRAIDLYCKRHFWPDGTVGTPVARTFEACDTHRVDFGVFNDLSAAVVPVVKTDKAGDGTFETTWTATDYQLLPYNRLPGRPYTRIEAIASLRFPVHTGTGRRDRVQITGVWGWDAIPDDVHQACLIKAHRIYTRHQSPNGVAGIGDFGPVRISRFEDPDVVDLLNPYRPTTSFVA
jgi:hypothetical protein